MSNFRIDKFSLSSKDSGNIKNISGYSPKDNFILYECFPLDEFVRVTRIYSSKEKNGKYRLFNGNY